MYINPWTTPITLFCSNMISMKYDHNNQLVTRRRHPRFPGAPSGATTIPLIGVLLVIRDLVDWSGWWTTLVSYFVLIVYSLCSLCMFPLDARILKLYSPALFQPPNVGGGKMMNILLECDSVCEICPCLHIPSRGILRSCPWMHQLV